MRWDLPPKLVPKVDPFPCPLCDKLDKVWAGIDSSSRSGVGCIRCHLSIVDDISYDGWPKSLGHSAGRYWAYVRHTKIAIEKWNKLPRAK